MAIIKIKDTDFGWKEVIVLIVFIFGLGGSVATFRYKMQNSASSDEQSFRYLNETLSKVEKKLETIEENQDELRTALDSYILTGAPEQFLSSDIWGTWQNMDKDRWEVLREDIRYIKDLLK